MSYLNSEKFLNQGGLRPGKYGNVKELITAWRQQNRQKNLSF